MKLHSFYYSSLVADSGIQYLNKLFFVHLFSLSFSLCCFFILFVTFYIFFYFLNFFLCIRPFILQLQLMAYSLCLQLKIPCFFIFRFKTWDGFRLLFYPFLSLQGPQILGALQYPISLYILIISFQTSHLSINYFSFFHPNSRILRLWYG